MGTEAEVVLQCITEDFVERAKVEYKHRLFRKVSEPTLSVGLQREQFCS
jgi:hypothetical protein